MFTYDVRKNDVVFSGVKADGFAKDTVVKAARNSETWIYQGSNSGRGTRSRNPDRSGRVELTLDDNSPTNALFQAIYDSDELSAEGVGELLVRDRNTLQAKVQAANAWFVKIPDWERKRESGSTVWVLEADELIIKHDGVIDG